MTTQESTIPETAVTPYLVIRGAADAIDFYKRAFGAVEDTRMDDDGKIGHAEIRIGGSRIMLADEYPNLGIVGPRALGGSPVRLQARVPNVDAVVGRAAAAGAKVLQPPTDQPYGERNAKLEDPFGHVWIFSTPTGKAAVRPIPEGYRSVTPYLIVREASKLIEFLQKAFLARERFRSPLPDGTIQHAEVMIGDSVVMLADAGGPWKPMQANINLYVEDCDGTYRRAMEAGGKSLREPATQFYGDRSAGVEDPWGNLWWISTHVEDVPAEEMERRAKAAHGRDG
jgi:PhnB protein